MTTSETRMPCTDRFADAGLATSRNLVVCIDGTSNQFGIKNTNIVELYSHITKNDKQLTYYSSGLGAIAKAAGDHQQFSSYVDIVFGRNLHKVIMASYRWLSDNYQNGDRIFLFGFSRGAYQVRALAGMIARVGLLLPGNNEQIPFAFDLYSKTGDDDVALLRPASVISQPVTKESEKKAKYAVLARTFQKTYCRSNVHIHFVGVWDTVSSVGIGRSKTLPLTTTSCEHICFFRHALALDERRVKFLPEYVYGGRSSLSDDGRIKEVWFAGCHSDVGGGNRKNEKLQSGDIPLLWMRSQAIAAGLGMDPVDVMWKIDDLNKQITPSLTAAWWPLELLPLKHLCYYNSDSHSSTPHLGTPRRILPGQKVHVSVLFKNDYKPSARFFNNPVGWPEPMFWNDPASHQRLHDLPDLWEKDIFDGGFIPALLDDLKRGQSILDALDRLAFLASFDAYKKSICDDEEAKQILTTFLKNADRATRLSTAVTYCELEWDWPEDMIKDDLGQQRIMEDVSELLKSESDKDCRRACISMPSLCKRPELKERLTSNTNLARLVQLCDNTRIIKHEEGISSVAFHSAQALSMLMKLDNELVKKLINKDLVTDILEALRSDCRPVLVAVLSVVEGLAKDQDGRTPMKAGPVVGTLLKLVKQFDDFVAPAAVRVLCSLLPEEDLRRNMLQFGVLSIFLEMLDECSDETKQVTCQALVEFIRHNDIQEYLLENGYLEKLAKRAQNPSKRGGAITALVTFGNTQVGTAVTAAIEAARTIRVVVGQLSQKKNALCAASALARLVRINDIAEMVSSDFGACTAILDMLRNCRFEDLRGEDGLQVLSELLECERLRSAVFKAGAIDCLRKMIESERYESTQAGLRYLRVIAGLDEDREALTRDETTRLIRPIVNALRAPQRRVQWTAAETLRFFSVEEDLRLVIAEALLVLLEDKRADVIFAASTALRLLSADESVRERVLRESAFWDLCHLFYNGLELKYNERKGLDRGKVYESVKRLIESMQAHEGDGKKKVELDEHVVPLW